MCGSQSRKRPQSSKRQGEPDVCHIDDAGERDRRRIGRPSTAEPLRPLVVELLAHDPALLSVEIFRRAKLGGHDFGQVEVRYLDGTKTRIHFFASRLKYSRWVEVTIVPDEQTETLVRTMVDHFTCRSPKSAPHDRR